MIIEDEEGNVLSEVDTHGMSDDERHTIIEEERHKLARETSGEHTKHEHEPHPGNDDVEKVEDNVGEPTGFTFQNLRRRMGGSFNHKGKEDSTHDKAKEKSKEPEKRHRGAAHAYQYGNTIIIEDEDGEVVNKYELPPMERKHTEGGYRARLKRMGTFGMGAPAPAPTDIASESGTALAQREPLKRGNTKAKVAEDPDENHVRFSLAHGGRRMGKADFIDQIRKLDPKARIEMVEDADAPDDFKRDVKAHARGEQRMNSHRQAPARQQTGYFGTRLADDHLRESDEDGEHEPKRVNSNVPDHDVASSIARASSGQRETAAQQRRRLASSESSSYFSRPARGPAREPSYFSRSGAPKREASYFSRPTGGRPVEAASRETEPDDEKETAAEQKRRLAALGRGPDAESDSEDDDTERQPRPGHEPVPEPEREEVRSPKMGIRFAEQIHPAGRR